MGSALTTTSPFHFGLKPVNVSASSTGSGTDDELVTLCGTVSFREVGATTLEDAEVVDALKAALAKVLNLNVFRYGLDVRTGMSEASRCTSELSGRRLPATDKRALFLATLDAWSASYMVNLPNFGTGAVLAAASGLSQNPDDFATPLVSCLSAAHPNINLIITDFSKLTVVKGQVGGLGSDMSRLSGKAFRVNILLMSAACLGLVSLLCLICVGLNPKRNGGDYRPVDFAQGEEAPPPYAACFCCGRILCSFG